ncbi:universal stress protein [Sulfitobacter aestuariivivens]|uniref:Universal stress protein n=1 Tax=Sulfitobacter aestuariivivens TaxID=2766981 RepID=A0A927D3T3_9RHOB|nr:universal stress protein [Sulfitobacter aestuariivivens]MBD3664459.1 universal stress protein [Sulfitobacter aestuariivivens]
MFRKILVGFDGSEPAERALRAACEIANKFDASLEVSHTPKDETVVFAAEAISGVYVGHTAVRDEMIVKAAEEMAKRAREIAAECGHETLEVHIGHGNPAEDILKRAKDDNVDLIVTGRRGLGDLRGLLLGSTSHGIGARAECACLTVA